MKTTLIISTYNRPEALSVCLDSVRFQTVMPDEVIVGDDGSTSETKDLIESFKKDFPVPLIHLWQEDKGFRLAMMRNKSVAAATGDYIIEIDGDIFLHNKFVEDHKRLAKPGHYLRGTRVNLGQKLTEEICKSKVNRRIYPWTIGIQNRAEQFTLHRFLISLLTDTKRTYLPDWDATCLSGDPIFWQLTDMMNFLKAGEKKMMT